MNNKFKEKLGQYRDMKQEHFTEEDLLKAAHYSNQEQRKVMGLAECDCWECEMRRNATKPFEKPCECKGWRRILHWLTKER